MSDQINLKDFVSGFVLEADEHLHSVNSNLVATSEALKNGRPEPRAVRELYRSLHTIKGLASMVGAEPIVDISHEMENILRLADRAGGRLSEPKLDLLLKGTRALEERIHWVSQNGTSGIATAPVALLEALGLVQTESIPTAPPELKFSLPPEILKGLSAADREQMIQAHVMSQNVMLVDFQPSPERAAAGLTITTVRERLAKIGELIKVVPRSTAEAPTGIAFLILLVTKSEKPEIIALLDIPSELVEHIIVSGAGPVLQNEKNESLLVEADETDEWMPTDHSSIRVDIRRLDEALERLSDLIVTRSRLEKVESDLCAAGVDTRELKSVIGENTRKLKRLRAAITQSRMVSLAELLQRIPLVVRGLTKSSDKSVDLSIQTGSAEVDKAVADKIFPAIVHLVRNAVDHAIENRADRARLGKPEAGKLSVACDSSSGTTLVLTITDDGGGINREAVARKAGRSVALNNEELLQQIATPGLSTSRGVTHTSGRGMGMEIVKRSIEMLSGSLSVSSVEGVGTTFSIRVPVSITIVDVLTFISDAQTFVVPISMVDEIIEIDPLRLVKSPVPARTGPQPQLLQRRGQAIPLLSLGTVLAPNSAPSISRRALVVNQHQGAIAFGVDRLLGRQEVVVRPLDDVLVMRAGIAGATDLGDGRPTLVLDLATLGTNLMQGMVN